MFETPNTKDIDCKICRWNLTSACPISSEYTGRKLFAARSSTYATKGDRLVWCHRFVMTADELERRWYLTMRELELNL
jgi:hypothetical protein